MKNEKLIQFLEKVIKCKNDVSLSYFFLSSNTLECDLTFNDFAYFDDNWNEVYRDYDNPQAVEELKDWLKENCIRCDDNLYTRYHFNDFIVILGYASYDV